MRVSIHAPTRGATCKHSQQGIVSRSFNPRTHTGCDNGHPEDARPLFCFNPRTHTGCDQADKECKQIICSFNPRTHTGCDKVIIYFLIGQQRFQSTHPHGVRQSLDEYFTFLGQFQSTHPHGVRQVQVQGQKRAKSFNPRTHTGCDACRHKRGIANRCFNPRTHTGCDYQGVCLAAAKSVSIHAPTRGATLGF